MGISRGNPGEGASGGDRHLHWSGDRSRITNLIERQTFQLNAYDVEKGEEITKFEQDLKVQVSYGEERYSGIKNPADVVLLQSGTSGLGCPADRSGRRKQYAHGLHQPFHTLRFQNTILGIRPTAHPGWLCRIQFYRGSRLYSYPIRLFPPGAGGWQPSLALTYNSQVVDNANSMTQASWVGMGWSLDTGYIQRNTGESVSFMVLRTGWDSHAPVLTRPGRDGDDTSSGAKRPILGGYSACPTRTTTRRLSNYRTENDRFWLTAQPRPHQRRLCYGQFHLGGLG